MSENLSQLKTRIALISRLGQTSALLDWDQQTYMPKGGAESRSEHSAAMRQITHEMFTSQETGSLLSKSEEDLKGMDGDSDDVRMLAVLRHDFDRETKLPAELVSEIARHTSLSQEIWINARKSNDFAAFAPALDKMIDLSLQQAECLGYKEHVYDALLDAYETGAKQSDVAAMFTDMKPHLVELTRAIANSKNPVDDSPIRGDFAVEKQKALTLQIVSAIGYDTDRGRQDEAAHPFCTNFSRDDVRITTRYNTEFLNQAVYASMHEAGHAMYEQGSPISYEATSLAGGVSLGVHESQSRLWENQVGRSRSFSKFLLPMLKSTFPEAMSTVDAEGYYRAVNMVSPSLIRVEADEVTYNLHILLRFELECDLLTRKLAVKDLPDAWNAKMQEYLGICPSNDSEGVLQDIHWSCGLIAYFPTYSIGNLLSAQLWNSASKAVPDIDSKIEQGEFAPLLNWLRENVHQYGRKYLPGELIQKATGEPLTSKYYVEYLNKKYTDIYSL